MTLPWFRMYSDFIFDEKIEFMAFEDQRHFVFVLCMKNMGLLDKEYPQDGMLDRVVAKRLGLYGEAFENAKTRLIDSGLIDEKWQPIAWSKRQFRSDADTTAAERKRRQREKEKESCEYVTRDTSVTSRVTCHDVTDVDVDTDTDTDTEKKKPAPRAFDALTYLLAAGVAESVAKDWLSLRRQKKAKPSETAIKRIADEAAKAGVSLQTALETCCARGWQGFDAAWLVRPIQTPPTKDERQRDWLNRLTGRNGNDAIDAPARRLG